MICDEESSFFKVGEKYLIRTLSMIQVGEVKSIKGDEIVLKKASWVADTGRFSECLKTGDLDEIEPFVSDTYVNKSSIVDATYWEHPLPEVAK